MLIYTKNRAWKESALLFVCQWNMPFVFLFFFPLFSLNCSLKSKDFKVSQQSKAVAEMQYSFAYFGDYVRHGKLAYAYSRCKIYNHAEGQ